MVPVLGLDDSYKIAETRQWILNHSREFGVEHVVMCDDDLRFLKRIEGTDPPRLQQWNDGEQLHEVFSTIEEYLQAGYVHASVSARQGNQNIPELSREVARPYRIYAFNSRVFCEEGIRFAPDGFPGFTQDDFYSCIQLLALGYPNLVDFELANDQINSDTEGGASTYRSLDSHNRCAEWLGSAYPDYIRVEDKQTKHSWNGLPRKDVVIYWRKLYGHLWKKRKSKYGESRLVDLAAATNRQTDFMKTGVIPI